MIIAVVVSVPVKMAMAATLASILPPRLYGYLPLQLGMSMIEVLIPIAIYGLLTLWLGPKPHDGETRCRKCDYILRGLPEPRCPECGERI